MPFCQGHWVQRDLSEIKPGGFKQTRSLANEYDSLRVQSTEDKIDPSYYTDPYHKYLNRKRAVSPRRTGVEDMSHHMKNFKRSKALEYETSDKGLALIMDVIKDVPKEKMASMKKDVETLKKELKQVAIKEKEEMKSGLNPSSAHKVYEWRSILEDQHQVSKDYSNAHVPSELFLPDKSRQLVTIYHRNHEDTGRLHNLKGFYQLGVNQMGPNIHRDNNGLKIITNLDPEVECDGPRRNKDNIDYSYNWAFTDPGTGKSFKEFTHDAILEQRGEA